MTVNRQGLSSWHGKAFCRLQDEGTELIQFRFEESMSVLRRAALEGVATDKFGTVAGLVGGSRALWSHFIKIYPPTELSQLPGGFGSS